MQRYYLSEINLFINDRKITDVYKRQAYVLIKITKTEKERSFSAAKANVAAPVFYRAVSYTHLA